MKLWTGSYIFKRGLGTTANRSHLAASTAHCTRRQIERFK